MFERHPGLLEQCEHFVARYRDSVPALAHRPGPERRRAGACSSLVDEQRLRRILARCSTRRSSSARTGSARSRATTSSTRTFSTRRTGLPRRLPAGGIRHRHVRRQLELARAGVVPDEPGDHSRRCCSCTCTTATTSRSSARPARARDEPREVARRSAGGCPRSSSATRTDAGRCSAGSRRSSPIRTGATCILFYEYFHGDNGAGLGASHQTGWTGLVALLFTHATAAGAESEARDHGRRDLGTLATGPIRRSSRGRSFADASDRWLSAAGEHLLRDKRARLAERRPPRPGGDRSSGAAVVAQTPARSRPRDLLSGGGYGWIPAEREPQPTDRAAVTVVIALRSALPRSGCRQLRRRPAGELPSAVASPLAPSHAADRYGR